MSLGEHDIEAIHDELLQRLDLRRSDIDRMADAELRWLAQRHLREILERRMPGRIEESRALERILLQEVVGLGPLEDLLEDDAISEIMVNGPGSIFVETHGRLRRLERHFTSQRSLAGTIERLLQRTGRRVDESSPMVDARLGDGSRINVIIPPLAIDGAAITIRRFSRSCLSLEDLQRRGALSAPMARFFAIAVMARRNIVVSGGTGTGKTTLLNCLSTLIPPGERIVTIEDSAELQLAHAHLVRLEARPANLEGRGQVSIRDLVRNALRMRPDRIVVGECRGAEALDMLQAMNTGHDGSLTTAHANSPRDLLSRLEVMALMAGMDLPLAAIREQIASAVHLIVQLGRAASGQRRVVQICEVTGTEAGRIQIQELFRFDPGASGVEGGEGEYRASGNVPEFYEAMLSRGGQPDCSLFETPSDARGAA
ncbi:MAG: secretion system protein [Pseudomonadota bacterium]